MRLLPLTLILFVLGSAAHAASSRPPGADAPASPTQEAARPPAADAKTHLAVDPAVGTIDVVVQGRIVARFTQEGLHVFGNVSYGGTIADTGETAP